MAAFFLLSFSGNVVQS